MELRRSYRQDGKGYEKGFSDARLASDLGVSIQWIKQEREDNFGDDGANEEIRGLLEQAVKSVSAIRARDDELVSLSSTIKRLQEELSPALRNCEKIEHHLAKVWEKFPMLVSAKK